MKAQDLRDKTPDQLREELASLKKRSVQPSLSTSDRSIGKHSTYAHSEA